MDRDIARDPAIRQRDNVSGFTLNQIFNVLAFFPTNLREFEDRLQAQSLGSTPNTVTDYEALFDIYDALD